MVVVFLTCVFCVWRRCVSPLPLPALPLHVVCTTDAACCVDCNAHAQILTRIFLHTCTHRDAKLKPGSIVGMVLEVSWQKRNGGSFLARNHWRRGSIIGFSDEEHLVWYESDNDQAWHNLSKELIREPPSETAPC